MEYRYKQLNFRVTDSEYEIIHAYSAKTEHSLRMSGALFR